MCTLVGDFFFVKIKKKKNHAWLIGVYFKTRKKNSFSVSSKLKERDKIVLDDELILDRPSLIIVMGCRDQP